MVVIRLGLGLMTDRRAVRRYDLSLRVVLRAPGVGNALPQQGKTRDVSTRGVYLLLFDQVVPRNGEFDLTMALPIAVAGGAGVFVRALARVVRVEEWTEGGSPRVGIAAVIRRYEIVRNSLAS